jgi:hypothetical protein
MYNMTQFSSPILQPQMTFSPVQQQLANSFALSPPTASQDQNSNVQQSFQQASSQFDVSAPIMQTFESYPQVQTQINLQGMPPLTVNTARIDPTKYSVP